MEVFYTVAWFILGICMGSFYHVVGYRLPRGENILFPKHSYCPTCGHRLGGLDLIPLFSFLFSRGKCRHCKQKISCFYPIIELVTGILFSLSFYVFGYSYEFFISLVISSLLSIVLVSDITYLIIPDSIIIISSILVTILNFVFLGWKSTLFAILSGIIMFTFMYIVMLIGNFIFKKESLGGADIKLMFLSGILLGPFTSLIVIFLSSLMALPVALGLYITKRENIIPYGPFLVLAMYILFLFPIDVKQISNIFLYIS